MGVSEDTADETMKGEGKGGLTNLLQTTNAPGLKLLLPPIFMLQCQDLPRGSGGACGCGATHPNRCAIDAGNDTTLQSLHPLAT
eukprot:1161023-Pelagomonas_calceolata.AAC.14